MPRGNHQMVSTSRLFWTVVGRQRVLSKCSMLLLMNTTLKTGKVQWKSVPSFELTARLGIQKHTKCGWWASSKAACFRKTSFHHCTCLSLSTGDVFSNTHTKYCSNKKPCSQIQQNHNEKAVLTSSKHLQCTLLILRKNTTTPSPMVMAPLLY